MNKSQTYTVPSAPAVTGLGCGDSDYCFGTVCQHFWEQCACIFGTMCLHFWDSVPAFLGQCACKHQNWGFGTVCLQAQVLGFWDSVPASPSTGVCPHRMSFLPGRNHCSIHALHKMLFFPRLFFGSKKYKRRVEEIQGKGWRNIREGLKRYKGRVEEIQGKGWRNTR